MKYVALALMVFCATAHAEDYASFELVAGAQLPLGDSTWNDAASTSPTGRAGLAYHMGEHLGFAGSLAATRELGLISRPLTHAAEMWRTMFLVHAFYEQRISSRFVIEPRLGVGLDVSFLDYNVAGTTGGGAAANTSETQVAFALEPALGAWVDVGVGFQVGGELGLPCTFGRKSDAIGPAGASYSSIEVSLLAGIRVTSLRD
ncbi:MAG: outer membrane beta-barrel protein [Kofleriaceae bacterium]